MGCRAPGWDVTIHAALLLAVCLLAPTRTYGQATAPIDNSWIARVTAAIEREGFRVSGAGREVASGAFGGPKVPFWWVDTAAAYARPSHEAVSRQATTVFRAMHDVLADEAPTAIFSSGQVWTKYLIVTQARRGDITRLFNALQAARSEREKNAAFEAFRTAIHWRVYDTVQKRWLNEHDFVNKTFETPGPPAPSAPQPPTPLAPSGPASAPSVKSLTLTAESATSVGPGEHVLFTLRVVLSAPTSSPMEITLGWRSQDGAFQYGQFLTITPPAADYAVPGICLRVVEKRGSPPPNPGAGAYYRFEVHGATRVGPQILITQTPIAVEARGQAPIPNPPAPTPARTPAQSSCKVVVSTE